MPEVLASPSTKRHPLRHQARKIGATLAAGLALTSAAPAQARETADHAPQPAPQTQPLEAAASARTVAAHESMVGLIATKHHKPAPHRHHKKPSHHKRHHPAKHHHHPKHHHRKPHHAVQQPRPPEAPPLANLHPEALQVPANVKAIMDQNVVRLPAIGCSGFLIRNYNGDAVGVLTAQHCSMLASEGHQSTDSSGQVYLNFGQAVVAETGASADSLQPVGTINEFLLNANSDNTRDQVLGAFAGHSMDEVINGYQQMLANVSDLPQGSVIYDSGWPVDQSVTPLQRQDFAMSVLGPGNWQITNGEQLDLLVAAVPLSGDSAECSWGDSGSGGFTVSPDGKPLLLGPLSAFNDFGALYNRSNPTAASDEVSYIQGAYHASMDGFAGVCGFSTALPSFQSGAFIAQVNAPPS